VDVIHTGHTLSRRKEAREKGKLRERELGKESE
jgi:aldehyde:ferredoxin oxidoreductase